MPPQVRFGGTFAPPLDAEKLAAYKSLADSATPQVKEAMLVLVNMMEKFNETPDSKLPGLSHPSGTGMIVPLHKDEVKRMYAHVPWAAELDMFANLFEEISDKPLRDAAFHLLWFGKELCLDRQPITADKL